MSTNIGFLLGAGASYELGLPLVDELTIEFKRSILKTWNTSYYKVAKEIEEIIYPLLNDQSMNYEDIIGRIEVEINRTKENRKLYQEWYALLGRYLEAIFMLLLERHTKNEQFINERLYLLEGIKEFCFEKPLWIFSLNHDLIIEIVANYFKIQLNCGFNTYKKVSGIKFEELLQEDMEKNKFKFIYNDPGINLIKLHGSLDLFTYLEGRSYLKLACDNKNICNLIKDINKLILNDPTIKEGVKCTNEITYYDEDNILQFLRMTIMSGKHKYSSRVSHNMDDWFFKIFKGHINYIKDLYCIGYSFQDRHINNVIYDWLISSNNRKIIIVNPFIKEVPNEFKHVSNQIEIVNKGFLEFLNKKDKVIDIKLNHFFRNLSRKNLIKLSS